MENRKESSKSNFMMDWERFGEQLRYYRNKRGLLQKDLAKAVDVTVNTISRLEIGSITCSVEMLLMLCEVLKVSPDALLAGNYNMSYSPFYERFRELKDDLKDQLADSIQDFFEKMN